MFLCNINKLYNKTIKNKGDNSKLCLIIGFRLNLIVWTSLELQQEGLEIG